MLTVGSFRLSETPQSEWRAPEEVCDSPCVSIEVSWWVAEGVVRRGLLRRCCYCPSGWEGWVGESALQHCLPRHLLFPRASRCERLARADRHVAVGPLDCPARLGTTTVEGVQVGFFYMTAGGCSAGAHGPGKAGL